MKKATHCIMFIAGIIFLACCWSLLSLDAILLAAPSGLGLVAAYFWIRQDIWKREADTHNQGQRDFRSDCRISFLMLFLIAIAQVFSPTQAIKGQWQFFVIIILLGIPMGDFAAPYADKVFTWMMRERSL